MEDTEEQESKFLQLPSLILEKIFLYCSYDEIAQTRLVCKRINEMNMQLLNKGFRKVEKFQQKCLRDVKAQLPRRESKRRHHPLAKKTQIISSIGTRLSLLNTTYNKFVDREICCFIPGKVIDEVFRVLKLVEVINPLQLQKTDEVIMELKDISSMAMEHFEEKMIPIYRTAMNSRLSETRNLLPVPPTYSLNFGMSPPLTTHSKLGALFGFDTGQVNKLVTHNKINKQNINNLRKDSLGVKERLIDVNRKIVDQDLIITEQNKTIADLSSKLSIQDNRINELNRKLLEYEQRFNTLLANLGFANQDKVGIGNKKKLNQQDVPVNHYSYPMPAMGSLVFANMMQPGLIPMGIGMQPMFTPTFMPSPNVSHSPMGTSTESYDNCGKSDTTNARLKATPARSLSINEPGPSFVTEDGLCTTNENEDILDEDQDIDQSCVSLSFSSSKRSPESDIESNCSSKRSKFLY